MQKFAGHFSFQSFYEVLDAKDESIVCRFELKDDYPAFDGHFDQFQLLPGAVELGMVNDVLSFFLKRPTMVSRLFRNKFIAPIRPHSVLEIKLEVDLLRNRSQWQISANQQVVGKGYFEIAGLSA